MNIAQQSLAARLLLDPTQHPASLLQGGMPAVEAEQRFNVHRNTTMRSLVTALAEGFPSVQRLVGAEFFDAMAVEAVRAAPPRHPVLLAYGADFADFIEGFEPCASLPYLADVARLDGLRRRAYHAADLRALDATQLMNLDPEVAAHLRVVLHPSVAVLASSHPARSIWAAQNGDSESAPREWLAETSLVFRQGIDIRVSALDAAMHRLLAASRHGASLADLLADPQNAEPFSRALALGLLAPAGLLNVDPLFDRFLSPFPNALH
jgi:hypothetical protein